MNNNALGFSLQIASGQRFSAIAIASSFEIISHGKTTFGFEKSKKYLPNIRKLSGDLRSAMGNVVYAKLLWVPKLYILGNAWAYPAVRVSDRIITMSNFRIVVWYFMNSLRSTFMYLRFDGHQENVRYPGRIAIVPVDIYAKEFIGTRPVLESS